MGVFSGSESKKMGGATGNKSRLVAMFTLTFGFFLVEIIVGYITNSMALVADSFHMLSDVAALIVAFVSVKVIWIFDIFKLNYLSNSGALLYKLHS